MTTTTRAQNTGHNHTHDEDNVGHNHPLEDDDADPKHVQCGSQAVGNKDDAGHNHLHNEHNASPSTCSRTMTGPQAPAR